MVNGDTQQQPGAWCTDRHSTQAPQPGWSQHPVTNILRLPRRPAAAPTVGRHRPRLQRRSVDHANHSGRALLDRRAAAALFGRLRSAAPPPGPLAGLTEQEHTTLELTGQGLSNRQIAGRMFVAEKTVKNYVSHVLAKLGMTSRTQVAVLAATEVRDHQPRAGPTARAS